MKLLITGTTVMAIYPQTTCFYKGVIKEQPTGGLLFYFIYFNFCPILILPRYQIVSCLLCLGLMPKSNWVMALTSTSDPGRTEGRAKGATASGVELKRCKINKNNVLTK